MVNLRLKEFENTELYRILKPGGKILIKSKIIGSLENYKIQNSVDFSVI